MSKEYRIDLLLDETKAKLSKDTSSSLLNDREIVRFWDNLPNNYIEGLTRDIIARKFEHDPKADLKPFQGDWRISKVEFVKGRAFNDGIILETLRLGFETSLVDGLWRLKQGVADSITDSISFTRFIPYIDPTKADDLLLSLKSVTSVVDPVIAGETYTGTFATSEANSITDADGSVIISQVLKLTNNPTNATELSALTPLIFQENEILELFGIESGVSDKLGYKYVDLSPASRSGLMAESASALESSIAGAGWTYADRRFDVKNDNTATFSLLFEKVAWNVWGHDPVGGLYPEDILEYDNAGTDNEKEIISKTWKNINTANLSTAISACRDGTAGVPKDTGYEIFQVQVRDNRNGSFNIIQRQRKQVNNITVPTGTDILDAHGLESGTLLFQELHFEFFTKTDLTDVTASVTTPSGWTLRSISPVLQRDGLYSQIYRYEKITWNVWGHDQTGITPDQVYPEDVREYDNAGTDDEKEIIIKTWKRIQNDDLATAENNCRLGGGDSGVKPEPGYIIIRVQVQDNRDGSFNIVQTQRKQVNNITVPTGTDILDAHGLESGTLLFQELHFEFFTKTDLTDVTASVTTPSGWTLRSISPVLQRDGLYSQIYRYEKITWNVWGHDMDWGLYPEDMREYDNAGTDDEKEIIVKTWKRIQNDDLATAREACRTGGTGVPNETGYIITKVQIRDNRDGSFDIVQTQRKQVNNLSIPTGENHLNIHQLEEGKIEFFELHFEFFTKTDLATATSSVTTPSGWKLKSIAPILQADGLYSQIYTYERATWTNGVGGSVVNRVTIAEENTSTDSLDYKLIDGGTGIDTTDIANVLTGETADAGYVIDDKRIIERANGEYELRKTQSKLNDTATGVVTRRYIPAIGTQNAQEIVEWHNISKADATLIYNDAVGNDLDMTVATYQPAATGHKLKYVDRIINANGSYSISRVTFNPEYTSEGWGAGNIAFDVDYSIDIRSLSLGVTIDVRTEFTRSQIEAFLAQTGVGGHGDTNLKGTSVSYAGKGRWSCRRVREKV